MSVTVQNRRKRMRSAVAAALTMLLLVPVGILFVQVWSSIRDQRADTTSERQGVQYLARLGPLLTALIDAQAAALPTSAPPARTDAGAALTAAVDGVVEIDTKIGADLGASTRWTGLRSKIEALPNSGPPAAALQAHGEAIELLAALYNAIGDDSRLARDPDSDVSHLQRAVVVDLPETVIRAARLADVSLLAAQPDADDTLRPQALGLRTSVESSVGRLTDNLQAAVTDTASSTLSGELLGAVDGIRQSIEALVRAAGEATPSAGSLATARDAMQDATADLSDTVLTEVDGLLHSRLDDLDDRAVRAQLSLGAAVLVALLALAAILGGRRRPEDLPEPADAGSAAPASGGRPFGPELSGTEVDATRRERSGALR